jgi:hypothetical protein
MTLRRLLFFFVVALLLALGFWFLRHPPGAESAPAPARSPGQALVTGLSSVPPAPSLPPEPAELSNPRVLELNSPRFDIAHDLVILNDLLTDWRLDFPHIGNPVGENAEITTALTGDNPRHLMLFPRSHPAINAAGEICDRWGTPFFFHALAGDRMELCSAGPDKKFGTADDASLTPP